MSLNQFGSMTEDEFVQHSMGYRKPDEDSKIPKSLKIIDEPFGLRGSGQQDDPPIELDWSLKGAVAPVKNQGSCGSCWAFSAVAALESAYFIKNGKLIEFSEQELVSCEQDCYGCQGGLMDSAFQWTTQNGGLCAEDTYPYTSGTTSARGLCQTTTCTSVPGSQPKGFIDIQPNEPSLLRALFENGPVSVAIEADQSVFQFYHNGVLTGRCGTKLNHGVLLVGYGIDEVSGQTFWKVKNSWGTTWGEAGYVRMQRGKRWPAPAVGECGIASKASYPIL